MQCSHIASVYIYISVTLKLRGARAGGGCIAAVSNSVVPIVTCMYKVSYTRGAESGPIQYRSSFLSSLLIGSLRSLTSYSAYLGYIMAG